MARSKKSQKSKSNTSKSNTDVAEEAVSEEIIEAPQETDSADTAAEIEAEVSVDETASDADAEVVEDANAGLSEETEELDAVEVEAEDLLETAELVEDATNEDAPETDASVEAEPVAATPAAPQVIVKKRGFFPMLLGGVLCAGLGYGGAQYLKPEGWPFPGANTGDATARIEALEASLADATAQAAESSALLESLRSDITADVEARLADVDVATQLAPLQSAIDALSARLTTVEAAPVAEAIVSPEATAAYEAQLAQMQQLLDDEVARLTDAKIAAENEEANAAKASAAARLQEAVATGMPFAAVLANIEVDVPDALRAHAEQGVPSLQILADEFSLAADEVIVETAKIPSDDQTILDKFLRTQLGLRSLTPQEGSSPDAILSRAEQAIRDTDLQTALTEISTLPEVGQVALADWTERANARLSVTSALSSMLAQ